MMIKLNTKIFGHNTRKKPPEDEFIEFDLHESITMDLLLDYVLQRYRDQDYLSKERFLVIVQLLHRALENGHSPNDLLMIAIAGNYRTPVYEQHLQPKQSLTE